MTNRFKEALGFIIPATLFAYFALFYPISRQIGLLFRQDLFILPFLFLFVLLVVNLKNAVIKNIAFSILFLICILPLSGLWNSGMSDQYILGGSLPWSDGFILYNHSMQFLFGQPIGATTALRPISVTFYGLLLRLTGNNFIFLYASIAILSALAVLLSTHAVSKYIGPLGAAFFFCNSFFYLRGHLGEYLTEDYGFFLGMLACALFLKGLYEDKSKTLLFGFFLMSLALNARPGPMIIYPFIIIWYIFQYSKGRPNRGAGIIGMLFALGFPFVINAWNTLQTYGSLDVPNRLVAEIVYGVCNGGQPWYFSINRPEILALANSDNALLEVVGMCSSILQKHPENITLAISKIITTLFFDHSRGLFSYFNGTNQTWMIILTRGGLIALLLAGIIYAIRNDKKKLNGFLLAMVIGFFLTQFVVPPFTTIEMRYDASSIWFHGLLISLVPQVFVNRFNIRYLSHGSTEQADDLPFSIGKIFGWAFVAIALFSPIFLKNNPIQIPQKPEIQCGVDEEQLVIHVEEGSYIYLQEETELSSEHYPNYRLPYVREKIHNIAHSEIFDFTDSITQPTAIIRGLDLETFQDALVFSPLELVQNRTGFVQFCGNFINPPILNNDRFFIPTSANFFE